MTKVDLIINHLDPDRRKCPFCQEWVTRETANFRCPECNTIIEYTKDTIYCTRVGTYHDHSIVIPREQSSGKKIREGEF